MVVRIQWDDSVQPLAPVLRKRKLCLIKPVEYFQLCIRPGTTSGWQTSDPHVLGSVSLSLSACCIPDELATKEASWGPGFLLFLGAARSNVFS